MIFEIVAYIALILLSVQATRIIRRLNSIENDVQLARIHSEHARDSAGRVMVYSKTSLLGISMAKA